MPTACVTGANRGLGRALATLLSQSGYTVFAACRSPSKALAAVAGVHVVPGVDVSTQRGVDALLAALHGVSVDLLVNNAGLLRQQDAVGSDAWCAAAAEEYGVNALGPLRVTVALNDGGHLAEGAKVVMITSVAGSLNTMANPRASKGAWHRVCTRCHRAAGLPCSARLLG